MYRVSFNQLPLRSQALDMSQLRAIYGGSGNTGCQAVGQAPSQAKPKCCSLCDPVLIGTALKCTSAVNCTLATGSQKALCCKSSTGGACSCTGYFC